MGCLCLSISINPILNFYFTTCICSTITVSTGYFANWYLTNIWTLYNMYYYTINCLGKNEQSQTNLADMNHVFRHLQSQYRLYFVANPILWLLRESFAKKRKDQKKQHNGIGGLLSMCGGKEGQEIWYMIKTLI